ncbi:hypothetical protein HDU96_001114 [Phlyctochytrium bullatum]|nr:hypothetical protein HDU96_001114 [Phlyctochytrium bullatum]
MSNERDALLPRAAPADASAPLEQVDRGIASVSSLHTVRLVVTNAALVAVFGTILVPAFSPPALFSSHPTFIAVFLLLVTNAIALMPAKKVATSWHFALMFGAIISASIGVTAIYLNKVSTDGAPTFGFCVKSDRLGLAAQWFAQDAFEVGSCAFHPPRLDDVADNLERPSASELWTARHDPNHVNQGLPDPNDPDAIFKEDTYTPRAKLDVSLGKLVEPLKWPEYDQGLRKSAALPHINSPPGYDPKTFDDPEDPPYGGYPNLPHQWTQLKDPLKYWDPQGRREYGDVLHRFDNLTDEWGVGPEVSPWFWVQKSLQVAGVIGLVALGISVWDPESHMPWTPKDFPYNGLRVELGGDPNDPSQGNATRAFKYEDNFDPNYKRL